MLIEDTYDNLAQEIKNKTGIDVHVCYQCGKCSAGCPTAGRMDLVPNKIVHMAQVGVRRKVLMSKALWNCVSCGTCTSRCPRNIDILGIINFFRNTAYAEGFCSKSKDSAMVYKLFLDNIGRHGRLFELEIGALYNLKSGNLFKDIELFPSLVISGKMNFLPENINDRHYIRKMIEKASQRGKSKC